MKKRGLSGTISMIMIILIVLVSISIIWLFVQPFVANSVKKNVQTAFGENASDSGCYELNLEPVSCQDIGNRTYEIRVRRGPGNADLREIKLEVIDNESNPIIISRREIPSELAFVTYKINSSELADKKISFVSIAGVLGENTCSLSNGITCSQQIPENMMNETLNETGCYNEKGVFYLNDFEDNCTRSINGFIDGDIEPIPYLGFHSVGPSHVDATKAVGAKFHRSILSWHKAYDENGALKEEIFEASDDYYRNKGMKVLLTIKPNHPDKSTCSYEIGERGIDETDSYPKNETEWREYVKFIVDKHYVQPILEGKEPILVGIQLGNEWSHQFSVNTTDNPNCNKNQLDNEVKLESMISLMQLTYEAIQEAQENLPNGVRRLPMTTFGVTGVDNSALKRGFNKEGRTYGGYFENGAKVVLPGEVSEEVVAGVERFIVESAPYYDYLDIHLRGDYYQDHGYVAQWIRKVWKDNGITGKGLSATEYGGPFHFYTTEYQEYYASASLAHSFYQGFDAIAWASWVPTKKLFLTFSLEAMTDWNNNPRTYLRNSYSEFVTKSSGFSKIRLEGNDTYVFLDSSNQVIGRINVSENVDIPSTFEQCSDGLDNDNDGLIDGQDSHCGTGEFVVDVEFDESGIYF